MTEPSLSPAASHEPVTIVQEGRTLHLVLQHPPANAFSETVVRGLSAAVDTFLAGDAKAAVVRSAVSGYFAAGADVKQIAASDGDAIAAYRDAVREPIERLAASGRPSIAAIDGFALGGRAGARMRVYLARRLAVLAARCAGDPARPDLQERAGRSGCRRS